MAGSFEINLWQGAESPPTRPRRCRLQTMTTPDRQWGTPRPRPRSALTDVHPHDVSNRAQGARQEQAANVADHARHDHRRGGRDHDGRARDRRAEPDRETGRSAGTNMIAVNSGNWSIGEVRQGQGMSTSSPSKMPPPSPRCRAFSMSRRASYTQPGHRRQPELVHADRGDRRGHAALIRSWPTMAGSYFTPQDVSSAAKVAVLGSVVADTLFGEGSILRARSSASAISPFVAGVMASKASIGDGPGSGRRGLAPHTAVQKKLLGSSTSTTSRCRRHLPRRRSRRRTRSSTRCAFATRSSRASRTTSWCARSKKWPASGPKRRGR